MNLTDEKLDEFIKLYKEEFKEDITRAEAREMAARLLTLYDLLAKQLPTVSTVEPKPTPAAEEWRPSIGFLRER